MGKLLCSYQKVTFNNPETATQGVTIIPLRPDDPIGEWYANGNNELEKVLSKRLAACDRTHLFEFDVTKPSLLHGINLDHGETLHGVFVNSLKNDVSITGPSRFDV